MSGADLLTEAVAVLSDFASPAAEQQQLRADYLEHLAQHPDGIWRSGPPVHLTASCFVLDPDASKVLLTLHRKGGFWVQFGGHLEPTDATLAGAALREATEESGLASLVLLPAPVGLHRIGCQPRSGAAASTWTSPMRPSRRSGQCPRSAPRARTWRGGRSAPSRRRRCPTWPAG